MSITYLNELAAAAREASFALATAGELKNKALEAIARKLIASTETLVSENTIDLENATAKGIGESMLDRLKLTPERILAIANAIKKVIALDDPIGKGTVFTRPNGLKIAKVAVPLGVVGIIYEARPNVTVDAAVLCIKSGNAVILRGGSEAILSNIALCNCIQEALAEVGLPRLSVQVLTDTSRETAAEMMKLNGKIDVLIPRGGAGLIQSVVQNSTIPVIETGAGNCHLYVDDSADLAMAVELIFNAKTSRPSVCNAVETLLVSESVACEFLPMAQKKLSEKNVELRGCDKTRAVLPDIKEATEEDYFKEYNDYILAVKVVQNVAQAVRHINKYGTKHSEAIVTRSMESADYFKTNVDAAAVYVNASTRFTDGEEFGLGAEIGISTQKLHARGPMGLEALTTVKYIVDGNGQVR